MAKRRENRGQIPATVLLGGVLLLIGLALLLGFAIVDFRAAMAILLGVAAAWLLVQIVRAIGRSSRRGLWVGFVAVIVLGVSLAFLLSTTFQQQAGDSRPLFDEGMMGAESAEAPRPTVLPTAYRLTLSPGETKGEMLAHEEVIYNVMSQGSVAAADQLLTLPERVVASETRGFLLREVTIMPLDAGAYDLMAFPLPEGGEARAPLCTYLRCPISTVRLEDFPQNAFVAARGVKTVESAPYLDTEIVTWTPTNLPDGITFAYIPAPFHHLRGVLMPLVGATSLDDWMIGLLAMIGSLIAAPLIVPILENVLEEVVGEWIKEMLKRRKEPSTAS